MCPATYIISIHAAFNTLEKHSGPRCVSFLNDTLLFQKMRSSIIARSHYKNCVQWLQFVWTIGRNIRIFLTARLSLPYIGKRFISNSFSWSLVNYFSFFWKKLKKCRKQEDFWLDSCLQTQLEEKSCEECCKYFVIVPCKAPQEKERGASGKTPNIWTKYFPLSHFFYS